MSHEENNLVERLLRCQEKLEGYESDLDVWTNSLEELSEIEDAFEADKGNNLHGKSILDVGTDCVKPLYIALKFEPDKIVGINEDLSYSFASEIEQKSKLFAKTEIKLYNCSFFDDENLKKILNKGRADSKEEKFDFVLVSKTLHHLRTGQCVVSKRDKNHECREDEECCIYKFEEREIFKRLLELGKRVIVYESFYPHEKDDDKVRGRGGYFTTNEWIQILRHLSENYKVEFIVPLRCHLDNKALDKMISKLRQVDCICFYVEAE